jgi:hypothetical protein
MAKLDQLSQQIVKLVRSMPDEAILELVRDKLGVGDAPAPAAKAAAPKAAAPAKAAPKKRRAKKAAKRVVKAAAPAKAAAKVKAKVAPKAKVKVKAKAKAKAPAKAAAPKKRGGRAPRADKAQLLEVVERTVRSSKGMSASQIADKTKLPQSRVAAAVRELKASKRIFQGGDRRFARYAGDRDTANKASLHARANAAGPKRT